MEAGIKSVLDWMTQLAKVHYFIVQSFEIFVPSVSFLSMIPCLFVIAKTGTLHWNCKLLLLSSATVQLQIIAMQLLLIIYEIHNDIYLPDGVGVDAWFMFVHEIGYDISTILSVYLVMERFLALKRAADYCNDCASWSTKCLLSFLAITFSVPWAYFSMIHGHYYIGIAVILSIELPMSVSSVILYLYSKKMYCDMHESSLAVRYQMAEILEYSRAVIPAIVFSSFIKSFSLITCILWQEGLGHYGFLRVIFFTIHTLNCVAMKTILIASHRGLRRTFRAYFIRRKHRHVYLDLLSIVIGIADAIAKLFQEKRSSMSRQKHISII